MHRRARTLGPATLAAAVLLAPAAATSSDLTLRLQGRPEPELAGRTIVTYAQAVRVFGRAVLSPKPAPRPACKAAWRTIGLQIDFASGPSASCVARRLGGWLEVRATSARWRTGAGLRVGDSESRLHAVYPNARRLGLPGEARSWELETGGAFCDGGPTLALAARVSAARIVALVVLHVPACG